MSPQRFYPTARFLLTIVVPSMAVGVGLGALEDSRSSPYFDANEAVRTALLVCAALVIPLYLFARWYGKVLIDATGISARDTLCRWRTIRWDSLSGVRKLRLPGLHCVLLSSSDSRWSIWLAGSLEPREALLSALAKIGPPAVSVRAQFTSAA